MWGTFTLSLPSLCLSNYRPFLRTNFHALNSHLYRLLFSVSLVWLFPSSSRNQPIILVEQYEVGVYYCSYVHLANARERVPAFTFAIN